MNNTGRSYTKEKPIYDRDYSALKPYKNKNSNN